MGRKTKTYLLNKNWKEKILKVKTIQEGENQTTKQEGDVRFIIAIEC